MKYLETSLDIADLEVVYCGRASSGIWAEAPVPGPDILKNTTPSQPESSRAAIEAFKQMCDDTASIISQAATWGTCRESSSSNPECIDTDRGDVSNISAIEADRTSGLDDSGSDFEKTHGQTDAVEGRGLYIAVFYPF